MPPLTLDLRPSRRLMVLLAVVHGLSLAAVITLDIGLSWRAILCIAVLLSLSGGLRSALRSGNASLTFGKAGDCEVEQSGMDSPCKIRTYAFLFGETLVLNLAASQGGHRTWVLMSDSATVESLRQLRVWLKTSV